MAEPIAAGKEYPIGEFPPAVNIVWSDLSKAWKTQHKLAPSSTVTIAFDFISLLILLTTS